MTRVDIYCVRRHSWYRAFKVSVGISPCHYINGRRVELACVMIKTTHAPLAQVAIAWGLCDQSDLCRVFRRSLGMSPAAWRRANVGVRSSRNSRRPIPVRRTS